MQRIWCLTSLASSVLPSASPFGCLLFALGVVSSALLPYNHCRVGILLQGCCTASVSGTTAGIPH